MKVLKVLLWVLVVLIAITAVSYALFSPFFSELIWLHSEGYLGVFFRLTFLKALSFLLPFAFSIIIFYFWLYLARGIKKNAALSILFWAISIGYGILGLLNWQLLLIQPSGLSMGYADPFFKLDAYFYISILPLVRHILMMLCSYSAIIFFFDLVLHRGGEKGLVRERKIQFHFSTMVLFIITAVLALFFYFSNALEILVSQPAVRLGVDYKTFFGYFIGASIWIILAMIMAIIVILRSIKGIGAGSLILYSAFMVLMYFGLTKFYPYLLNTLYVKPNELMVQKPFTKHRIASTRFAFNLNFTPVAYPKYVSLASGLNNIMSTLRIWDSDPYKKVIDQVQSIKTYFDFRDVDVDAYPIPDGKNTNLRQTVLSARELNVNDLPADALNWDNIHLRYTHGNGVVVSPADTVDREGSPEYWVKDLDHQPEYSNLIVRSPQIYFGEITSNYIIVHTTADEFEYTASTNRVTYRYELERGVRLNNLYKKILFSVVMKEKNIFLSKYITTNSAILYHREIHERVKNVFPYLAYDPDAYITIAGGRLVWIIDAYTTSARFPMAEKYETQFGKLNYIRNSVKVTVDAYSGEMKFYLVDASDPIAASYRFLFPKLFSKEIPQEIKDHFRYPYGLLKLQSDVLCKYHVDNEDSFYNGDDVWEIPRHIYGDKTVPFEPYYIIVNFSAGSNTNFVPRFSAIQPFSPRNKEVLASWVMAYYDNGPRLALQYGGYTSSALGPMQVESRINQDDRMSSFFTLWGQKGAKTFRGNVRFIPVNGQIFYVEPIFLESTSMSIPQLVKIVGILNNKVYLGNNYEELTSAILDSMGAKP